MAADMEQTAISFEVMTGSAKVAKGLMDDLRAMGAATPFEFTDLAQGSKTLMGFGRTAQEVLKDIDMLSNVAAGDAQKLQSLSLVFGQIAANGRLTGGDLLQLVNVGFNPLNSIAKKTGESMTELRDRMSKGKIGFEEVRQAFADATSAGGQFYKMNEKQSQTLLGKWSTLKDEFNSALMEMGQSLIENLDLKGITASLSGMIQTFKTEWVPVLQQAIELAPKLIEAFSKVASTVAKIAGKFQEMNAAIKEITGGKRGLIDALAPGASFLADRMKSDVKGGGVSGMADAMKKGLEEQLSKDKMWKIDSSKGPQTLEEMYAKEAKDREEMLAKQWKNPAEQAMAGFIRNGIAGMQSGLMSLGPLQQAEKMTNEVGSLEKNSAESFDVLRANIGPGGKDKVQEQQLTEQKKQTKKLDEIAKSLGKSAVAGALKVFEMN